MQIVILAGGLATRLRPLTQSIPKSLINIEGKPFIEYQIDLLKQQGLTDVVLCVGYLGEQIEACIGDGSRFGVKVQYSYETDRLLGTAGAVKQAELLLSEEFFIMYGDSYLFFDCAEILSFFNCFNKLGMMTVYKNRNQFDKSNIIVDGNLVKVYDKKKKLETMDYIDYGLLFLRKECLDSIPDNKFYSLEELLTPLVNKQQILAYKVSERFYEIGSFEGIKEFNKYLLALKAKI
jgi:N-acetyl-alpha-D-muramate 1-phosphate uridylyltransferase